MPPATSAAGSGPSPPRTDSPGRRINESKHSTDIRACLTLSVNAHTDARWRRKRFNVGRVLVLKTPLPGAGSAHPQ